MMPIFIDTKNITAQYSMSKQQVDSLLDFVIKEIGASYAKMWADEAKHALRSTRERYINSLQVIDSGRLECSIVLDYTDPMVRMIEEGAGAFDMKEGFFKSSKKKLKKGGGWYMYIPFRVATPDALGESSVFSGKMPQEVYDIAKKLEPESLNNKVITQNMLPKHLQEKGVRPAITNLQTSRAFEEYKHKTALHAGITKKKDSVTGQSSYVKFRAVSDNSDDDAFIHTGINAYNLADKAMNELEANIAYELNDAINTGLNNLGF